MKSKLVNKIKIVLPAQAENEATARGCISQFVARADPLVSVMADIRCVISEAVTNCVVHAYRGAQGNIYINAGLYENGDFTVQIADKGCGIPDVALAMTPMYTTDKEGERSGMGFAIMQTFCDELKVTSKVGHGTKVFMKINIRRQN